MKVIMENFEFWIKAKDKQIIWTVVEKFYEWIAVSVSLFLTVTYLA